MQTFPDWLIQRFLTWQQSAGGRRNLKDFAEYLGVRPTTLSNWLNTPVTPSVDMVIKLSEKLGPEIYDVLGMARPDPRLRKLQAQYDAVPEDKKDELLRIVEDYLRSIGAQRTR